MLEETSDVCINAADGIYTYEQRELFQLQVNSLIKEIEYITLNADFQGKKLFDGNFKWKGGRIEKISLKDMNLIAFDGKIISIKYPEQANANLIGLNNSLNKIKTLAKRINKD